MERRPYRMQRRAERQAETRRRIVEAAVDLHTTVGPGRTSLSAIAERAGVQRHTLYAHFPDQNELFRACAGHWRATHPFPEPSESDDPWQGLARGLRAVFDWYEDVADEFALFVRDGHVFPEFWAERQDAMDALAADLAAPLGRARALHARVGHALEFETWESLRRHGLSQKEAVDAMLDLVRGAHRG
jgi:AcrR family transcriptional regulator